MIEIFEPLQSAFGLSADEYERFRIFCKDAFKLDEFRKSVIRPEAEKYKYPNEEIYNIEYYKATYKGIDEKGEVYYRWIYLM